MAVAARKVTHILAKSKAVKCYIARKEACIEYAIYLALPNFLEAHSEVLNRPFKLEEIVRLQNAALSYAAQYGQFEQMMRERVKGFKNDIDFFQTIFGTNIVSQDFSEAMRGLVHKIIIPAREENLRLLKTLSSEEVLDLFSKTASTWAVQQYEEGRLTMWQVLKREPLLLIVNW